MKNIVFCNLSIFDDKLVLPYAWTCLKTYCEQNLVIADNYNWIDPILIGDGNDELNNIDIMNIDILGLNCYGWNHERNYKIASKVKKINPQCLVIAGGPEPDYSDIDFFTKYPDIDIIVKEEGEQALHDILITFLESKDFLEIPGLIIQQPDQTRIDTGVTTSITNFDISPLIEQKDYLEKIIDNHSSSNNLFQAIFFIWETARGCPYNCAYCRWNFTNRNKMKLIPIERLQAEIQWFNTIKKSFLLQIIDANFGIYKRDLEVSQYLCDNLTNKNLKFTQAVLGKSTPYSNKIADLLYRHKFFRWNNIGIQHTDSDVLKEMNRDAVDVKKAIDSMKSINKDIPNLTHLILGSPKDTFTKWKICLTDLAALDIEEFIIYRYLILPNSQASKKEFMEKNEIETISRFTQLYSREKTVLDNNTPDVKYIISTSTYKRADYLKMDLFVQLIHIFHTGGVMKYISKYLVNEGITTYYDFYSKLFDFLNNSKGFVYTNIFEKSKNHMYNFINNDNLVEEIEIEEIPNSKYLYKTEEYMLFKFLYNHDRVWEELSEWVTSTFGDNETLKDLINYQKNILINFDYVYSDGREFTCKYDWRKYFKTNILELSNTTYTITDTRSGYNLHLNWIEKDDMEKRIHTYINTVIGICYKRCNRTIFTDFDIV